MTQLTTRHCEPCRGGTPPLKGNALTALMEQLAEGWKLVNEHHLEREFKFKDFLAALAFTNQVGALAEQENHHPEIFLTWGKVRVSLYTHKVGGLSENDFILAAKIDTL